ncbi:MAG TPA: MFS transporter [Candidatus Limnocylindrales bacterium]
MLRVAVALFLAQLGYHAYVASLPLALLHAGRPDALIGALMGAAALIQIPAAFLAGGLIDRLGGRAVFVGSAASFLGAATLLAAGLAAPGGWLPALVLVRLLQGVGLAAAMPAALSLVPGLVAPSRLATGLSLASLAGNVSLAIAPPASLAIVAATSFQLLSTLVLAAVAGGLALGWTLPRRAPAAPAHDTSPSGSPDPAPPRRPGLGRRVSGAFRPAWRPSWALLLLGTVLYLAHWGVLTGYLPQRAAAAGADVGFLFTADAVSLMVLRLPFAWLADRVPTHGLVVAGLLVTIGALVVLLLPLTTASMVLAGVGTGGGAALILPPLTVEISRRSDETDRGSAFALYSVAFAVGTAGGSIGLAPLIDRIGFETALWLGIAGLAAAIAATLADRRLVRARATAAAAT